MDETIEVRYKQLGPNYHHKYIVYTDSDGNEYGARGGPTTGQSSHAGFEGISEEIIDTSGFGNIATEYGEYKGDVIDGNGNIVEIGFADYDADDTDPRETMAEGADLSTVWESIKTALDNIGSSNIQYQPFSQNSNTVIDAALIDAGLTEPQDDNFSENWAPGSGDFKDSSGTNNSPGNNLPENSSGGQNNGENQASPLVLDLDGDGIELTSLATSNAFFDVDQDGFAEQTGWVSADDGLLVIDSNANGRIDDISELFGTKDTDGFAVLRPYDTNDDGVIDSNDAQFSDLRIWTDTNQDGISEASELHTLDSLNIASLNTNAELTDDPENVSGHDLQGNTLTHISSYTTTSGDEEAMADVWFNYDNMNSKYSVATEFDILVFYLPTIKGSGDLSDLHIQMSLDNSGTGNLLDLMSSFANKTSADYFTTNSTILDQDIENILFRWAGVDGIDPNSRGEFVDARKIAFVEAYNGNEFTQYNIPEPRINAGSIMNQTFDYIADVIKMQIIFQSTSTEFYGNSGVYAVETGKIEGELSLSQSGIDLIESLATASATPETEWVNFVQFLGYSVGIANLTAADITALDAAIAISGGVALNDLDDVIALTEQSLGEFVLSADDLNEYSDPNATIIDGTSTSETLTGFTTDDVIDGKSGDDIIFGLGGNDTLTGGSGNDTLDGGLGSDYLRGGSGDDIYYYDGGDDTFDEVNSAGDNDEIMVRSSTGLISTDVDFIYRDTQQNMIIRLNTGDDLVIDDHFQSVANEIEKITFESDGSFIDLSNLTELTTLGTDFADEITGLDLENTIFGYEGNDKLTGHDQNDQIFGGMGSDRIQGEDGDDTLHGEEGDDLIIGGRGNDILDGGAGNDRLVDADGVTTFIASSGDDTFINNEGEGTIQFSSGTVLSDLSFTRHLTDEYDSVGWGTAALSKDLEIEWQGNSILLENQYTNLASQDGYLRYLDFDGTVVDLANHAIDIEGSEEDNILSLSIAPSFEAGTGEKVAFGLIDQGYTINGYGGLDLLTGGFGDDSLYGGSGNDFYTITSGHDVIEDSSGNDTLIFQTDITGFESFPALPFGPPAPFDPTRPFSSDLAMAYVLDNPYMEAGSNNLTVNLEDLHANVETNGDITLTFGDVDSSITLVGQTLNGSNVIETIGTSRISLDATNIENWLFGTTDNASLEIITGDISGVTDDVIFSYSGDDEISTLAGNDIIFAGDGNDVLHGGLGNDYLEAGNDNDILDGGAGNDTLNGGSGDDTFFYRVSENVGSTDFYDGSSGDDTLRIFLTAAEVNNTDIQDDLTAFQAHVDNGNPNQLYSFDEFDLSVRRFESIEVATTGTANNDIITGSSFNEVIDGLAGDDTINGLSGNDTLSGGAGIDTLFGEEGEDTLYTGIGTGVQWDTPTNGYYFWRVDDALFGGNGNDTLYANDIDMSAIPSGFSEDAFYLNGGDGDDILQGGNGSDKLEGGKGDDIATGGDGYNTFIYNLGDDSFTITMNGDGNGGAPGSLKLVGISFSDITFETQADNASLSATTVRLIINSDSTQYIDVLDGLIDDGLGLLSGNMPLFELDDVEHFFVHYKDDPLYQYATATSGDFGRGEAINYGAGPTEIASNANDVIFDTNNIDAKNGHDVIHGTSQADNYQGGNGNDILYGMLGNDLLQGGAGNDILYGGEGNDDLRGQSGIDTYYAGAGNDFILGGAGHISYGEEGNDVIRGYGGTGLFDGGEGTDRAWWRDYQHTSSIGMTVDLVAGTAIDGDNNTATLTGIEDLTGSVYADTLHGDEGSNKIRGGADRFGLTDGDDTIFGYGGTDYLYGDNGNDTIHGGDARDFLYGLNGDDVIYGDDGNDKIWGGSGDDNIFGGSGLDLLRGDDGNDTIHADSGNNTIYGGNGNDIIYGGNVSGFDNIFAEAGDDTLYATAGNDFLRGGTGSDTFVLTDINHFTGSDAATIKNGFDVSTTGDNDVLDIKDIIDYDSSTDVLSDFVALTNNGSNTTVSVDLDGTGTAHNFTTVAVIQSAAGNWTDAADMLSQNNLIVE